MIPILGSILMSVAASLVAKVATSVVQNVWESRPGQQPPAAAPGSPPSFSSLLEARRGQAQASNAALLAPRLPVARRAPSVPLPSDLGGRLDVARTSTPDRLPFSVDPAEIQAP